MRSNENISIFLREISTKKNVRLNDRNIQSFYEHHSFYYYILYSSGEQGIDVFSQEAERRNICIALQQKVPSNANNDTYLEVR